MISWKCSRRNLLMFLFFRSHHRNELCKVSQWRRYNSGKRSLTFTFLHSLGTCNQYIILEKKKYVYAFDIFLFLLTQKIPWSIVLFVYFQFRIGQLLSYDFFIHLNDHKYVKKNWWWKCESALIIRFITDLLIKRI